MNKLVRDKEMENLFPDMDAEAFAVFVKDIETHGQIKPISITKEGTIIDGYQRLRACGQLGITPKVEVVDIDVKKDGVRYALSMNAMRRHLTPAQLYTIAKQLMPALREEAKERQGVKQDEGKGKDSAEIAAEAVGLKPRNFYKLKKIEEEAPDLFERMKSKEAGVSVDRAYSVVNKKKVLKGSLYRKYIIPPLSVFNTYTNEWQQQKTFWLDDLGIKSEIGRDEQKTGMINLQNLTGMTLALKSVFDPVLVEILVRWFSNVGEVVYDPFCGGSVRGVVSGWLGRTYIGTDLSQEQIDENRKQTENIWKNKNPPEKAILPCFEIGDAANPESYPKQPVDLILTCPPYFDLEKYGNGENDVSGMTWADFKVAMQSVADNCISALKGNGFIIFVVGDIRDKVGYYRNLPGLIVDLFTNGKHKGHVDLYNKAIYLTAIGSSAMRVDKMFNSQRKLVLVHQEVFIFYKGDPSKIGTDYEKFEDKDLWKEEFLDRE